MRKRVRELSEKNGIMAKKITSLHIYNTLMCRELMPIAEKRVENAMVEKKIFKKFTGK